jgi:urate oxidase
VVSGVRGVLLLKSTASAFKGFPRDEYTTLPETDDRILSTSMDATWTFNEGASDFAISNAAILPALLQTFAGEFSPSVQNTLYLMGQAALVAAPAISSILIAMPNKHYLPINLKPFGLTPANEIFLPTDEPHGQIEACITRPV